MKKSDIIQLYCVCTTFRLYFNERGNNDILKYVERVLTKEREMLT